MDWGRLSQMPHMRSVMTPFPYFVDIDATVRAARALMDSHSIRHLPVVSSGELVGVIGDRGVKRAADPRAGGRVPTELTVRDLDLSPAFVVDLLERVDAVLKHMAETPVDCALVVKEGRLAGIFTVTDACREFSRLLAGRFPTGGNEAA